MTDRALIATAIASLVVTALGTLVAWRTGHHVFALVFVVATLSTAGVLASVVLSFSRD